VNAEPNDPTDTVVVGRIGRPHGVRGEVTVEVRTDDPDLRFAPGAVLRTDPVDRGPLTVAGRRWHREVLLLTIEGVESREAAEELRNTELHVPVADLPALEDPDVFYDHQLVGLTARPTAPSWARWTRSATRAPTCSSSAGARAGSCSCRS
jgi:16S rRNA processing protein RimM